MNYKILSIENDEFNKLVCGTEGNNLNDFKLRNFIKRINPFSNNINIIIFGNP